jgi:hypothetical protein
MNDKLDRANSYIKELHQKIASLERREKQKQPIVAMVSSRVSPKNTDKKSVSSSLKDNNARKP